MFLIEIVECMKDSELKKFGISDESKKQYLFVSDGKEAKSNAKTIVGSAGYLDWSSNNKPNLGSDDAQTNLLKAKHVVELRQFYVPLSLRKLVGVA